MLSVDGMEVKFIQLISHEGLLYALDSHGNMWVRQAQTKNWLREFIKFAGQNP